MTRILRTLLLLAVLAPAALWANSEQKPADSVAAPDVRILYYTGEVSIVGDTLLPHASIGRELGADDVVRIGRGSSLQVVVDGNVLRYDRAGRVAVASMLRSAPKTVNHEVRDAVRYLATLRSESLLKYVGPVELRRKTSTPRLGRLVQLEPRSTPVLRAPLVLRWLPRKDASGYLVRIENHYGDEVFRAVTSDTSFVWDDAGANLYPGTSYTWTLATLDDTTSAVSSSFRPLDDLAGTRAVAGESKIRLALGNTNPALAMVLGAHYGRIGVYNESVRNYVVAATRLPEHAEMLLSLADQIYRQTGLDETYIDAARFAALGNIEENDEAQATN